MWQSCLTAQPKLTIIQSHFSRQRARIPGCTRCRRWRAVQGMTVRTSLDVQIHKMNITNMVEPPGILLNDRLRHFDCFVSVLQPEDSTFIEMAHDYTMSSHRILTALVLLSKQPRLELRLAKTLRDHALPRLPLRRAHRIALMLTGLQ